MRQLKLGLWVSLCLFVVNARAMSLELYSEAILPSKSPIAKDFEVGGISGFQWSAKNFYAVSDDRGKKGDPRLYELDLKIKAGTSELSVKKTNPVKGAPENWVLDQEALVVLPSGELLISTEGDNNKKPRALPHLFVVDSNGSYKSEWPLPDKFIPETLGIQTKGIVNNRGVEGMTANADASMVYAINEHSLVTDTGKSDEEGHWDRLLEYTKGPQGYKVSAEYPYRLDKYSITERGPEVYRSVAEILWVSDKRFIFLERGVRLGAKGVSYPGALYLVDFSGVKDVSKVSNLAESLPEGPKKIKLVDLEELMKDKFTENFEALSWGPKLPNGKKSLLVMSDNNFSKNERSQLLIFSVKEEP